MDGYDYPCLRATKGKMGEGTGVVLALDKLHDGTAS